MCDSAPRVCRDAGTGIQAALVSPVECQARFRDLDDQHRLHRMLAAVVAHTSPHRGDIGLRLRPIIERERPLRAHQPARPEGDLQSILYEGDCGVVGAALRLGNQDLAAEELDALPGARQRLGSHTLAGRRPAGA